MVSVWLFNEFCLLNLKNTFHFYLDLCLLWLIKFFASLYSFPFQFNTDLKQQDLNLFYLSLVSVIILSNTSSLNLMVALWDATEAQEALKDCSHEVCCCYLIFYRFLAVKMMSFVSLLVTASSSFVIKNHYL